MEFNKKNVKAIILIIFSCIAFCVALINMSSVWSAILKIVGIFTPVILGVCIAFLLDPMTTFAETTVFGSLTRRVPKRGKALARGLGLLSTFIIVAGIIAVLVLLVVPEVSDAFEVIGETLPSAVANGVNHINSFLTRFEIELQIPTGGSNEWVALFSKARDYVKSALEAGFLSDIASTALTVVGGITDFVLGLIFSIYILMQKDKITDFLKRAAIAYLKPRSVKRLFKISELTKTSFRNFVSGQLTEAVIIGVLCFIGMIVFRFPYPTATSAVVGVFALIPVFGAWIGGILGALLALSESFTKALLFIVFLIILQQIEGDFIYPRVVGKSVGLPGILVFFAVMMGASISGVVGMLLAVPLCSIFYTLIKESMGKRLSKASINQKQEIKKDHTPPPI